MSVFDIEAKCTKMGVMLRTNSNLARISLLTIST